MSNPLITPQLNINGTSKDELLQQLDVVQKCADALNTAMANAMPHGRDYQTMPNGDAMAQEARREWNSRREHVSKLYWDVTNLMYAISGPND